MGRGTNEGATRGGRHSRALPPARRNRSPVVPVPRDGAVVGRRVRRVGVRGVRVRGRVRVRVRVRVGGGGVVRGRVVRRSVRAVVRPVVRGRVRARVQVRHLRCGKGRGGGSGGAIKYRNCS